MSSSYRVITLLCQELERRVNRWRSFRILFTSEGKMEGKRLTGPETLRKTMDGGTWRQKMEE